jgi:DNA (cytosine-5)-methyltransferase 1
VTLTLMDMFCGAGGSSTGAIQIPGVKVKVAANHWKLAIETHNTNHPETDHDCADISQVDPRRYPRTDVLWASPECTNHSQAKGIKRGTTQGEFDLFGDRPLPDEAAERSRATMWDVPGSPSTTATRPSSSRTSSTPPDGSSSPHGSSPWSSSATSTAGLAQLHARPGDGPARTPVPRPHVRRVLAQGQQAPGPGEVDPPAGVLPRVWMVRAMQVFKRRPSTVGPIPRPVRLPLPERQCRNQIVEPGLPASPPHHRLVAARSAHRRPEQAPRGPKTLARIRAGIERYWSPLLIEAAGNTYDAADPKHPAHGRSDGYYRAWPTGEPVKTVHTTLSKALVVPVEGRDGKTAVTAGEPLRTMTTRSETALAFIAELRGGGSDHRSISEALATVTASGNHHGLVTTYYGNGGVQPTDEALATATTVERHAPTGGTWRNTATTSDDPVPTRTTRENDGLAFGPTLNVDDVLFRMLEPREIKGAMDFPAPYRILGNRREQVRQTGNAVCPPNARDLVGVVAESLGVA